MSDWWVVAGTQQPNASQAPGLAVDGPRLRVTVVALGVVLGGLAIGGSLLESSSRPIMYVASLGIAAIAVLGVALRHDRQARAWRLVGAGITVWALTGVVVTAQVETSWQGLPDIVVSLGYALGYVPCLVGFADLVDPRVRVRRWSGLADGLLVFLVLYGVLWLLVVEHYAFDSELPHLDRAFSALYPAGDIALVMLAVRIWASRSARRRVALLLLVGSVLSALADTMLLAFYLINPDGSFPITDLLYLAGLGAIALAAIWSLLPAPPAVPTEHLGSRRLPVVVTATAVVPALLLLGVVSFSDRAVEPTPIAIWLAAVVVVLVARAMSGVRALERAHQQALWLASHDLATGALLRAAFLHEVSEGSLRERSGTIIVAEVQRVSALADGAGLDAADAVLEATAARLRTAIGADAFLARFTQDRFVAFLRAADLGHGRQVATTVEKLLAEPVQVAEQMIPPVVAIGVAQADGAVIDVTAGVRRATAAMQQARLTGRCQVLFDADLMGRGEPVTTRPVPGRGAMTGVRV